MSTNVIGSNTAIIEDNKVLLFRHFLKTILIQQNTDTGGCAFAITSSDDMKVCIIIE